MKTGNQQNASWSTNRSSRVASRVLRGHEAHLFPGDSRPRIFVLRLPANVSYRFHPHRAGKNHLTVQAISRYSKLVQDIPSYSTIKKFNTARKWTIPGRSPFARHRSVKKQTAVEKRTLTHDNRRRHTLIFQESWAPQSPIDTPLSFVTVRGSVSVDFPKKITFY